MSSTKDSAWYTVSAPWMLAVVLVVTVKSVWTCRNSKGHKGPRWTQRASGWEAPGAYLPCQGSGNIRSLSIFIVPSSDHRPSVPYPQLWNQETACFKKFGVNLFGDQT